MKRIDITFEIKRLTNQDLAAFKSLVNLFNTVFEESQSNIQSETNLIKLLNNNNFIALVAISDNEVIGGLTAYELPLYYSESSEVFSLRLGSKARISKKGDKKAIN